MPPSRSGHTGGEKQLADVDGDGRADLVLFNLPDLHAAESVPLVDGKPLWEGIYGVLVARSTGHGFSKETELWAPVKYPRYQLLAQRQLVDVNGDGRADLLEFDGDGIARAYLSDGSGFAAQPGWQKFGFGDAPVALADVDGDGWADAVASPVMEVFAETASGPFPGRFGWQAEIEQSALADVNGDGLPDAVRFGKEGVEVALSTGRSFTRPERWHALATPGTPDRIPAYGEDRTRLLADVTGDGLADLIRPQPYRGACYHESTGSSFSNLLLCPDMPGGKNSWDIDCGTAPLRVADVNGDGRADAVCLAGRVNLALSKGVPPNLLTTVTDGLGGHLELEYESYEPAADDAHPVPLALVVVARHTVRANGAQPAKTELSYEHEFQYPLVDRDRGWLGFQSTSVVDRQNQIRTTTTHRADFPYQGLIGDRIVEDLQTGAVLEWTKHSFRHEVSSDKVYLVSMDWTETERTVDGAGSHTQRRNFLRTKDGQHLAWIFDEGDTADPSDDVITCFDYRPAAAARFWEASAPRAIKVAKILPPTGETDTDRGFNVLGQMLRACSTWNEWNPKADLRWQQFDYDESMNLVRQRTWLDTESRWIETGTGYDDYGNATTFADALNNVNIVLYDSRFQTFPQLRISPPLVAPLYWASSGCAGEGGTCQVSGNHLVRYGYGGPQKGAWSFRLAADPFSCSNRVFGDPAPGRRKRCDAIEIGFLRENGLVERSEYDPRFGVETKNVDGNGRVLRHIPPSGLDGFGRVVEVHGATPEGDDLVPILRIERSVAAQGGVSVTTRHRSDWQDREPWLWQREDVDGLGRTYRTESPGFDSQTVTVHELAFDRGGRLEKQFQPYFLRGRCVQYLPEEPPVTHVGWSGRHRHYRPVKDICHHAEKPHLRHEYDSHGRPSRLTHPDGAVETFGFEHHDRLRVVHGMPDPRDPPDGHGSVSRHVLSDSRGRVVKKVGANGASTSYVYDRLGRLARIVDPLGAVSDFRYNSLGWLLEETRPVTGTARFAYTDRGELARRIDAEGHVLELEYDALGRLRERRAFASEADRQAGNPSRLVQFHYDDDAATNGRGRLTRVSTQQGAGSGDVVHSFDYDHRGQLRRHAVSAPGKPGHQKDPSSPTHYITDYQHDALGRERQILYPDGLRVAYAYGGDGRLHTISAAERDSDDFTVLATYGRYTPRGQIGLVDYPAARLRSTYGYDVAGRLEHSKTENLDSGLVYAELSYVWNRANKLREIVDHAAGAHGQRFDYDASGRLVGASGPYPESVYAYDAAGNLTLRGDLSFSYGAPHQISEVVDSRSGLTRSKLRHDANGNLVAKEFPGSHRLRYDYDAENRLVGVHRESASGRRQLSSFAYDGSGDRRQKTDHGVRTHDVHPADVQTVDVQTVYISSLFEVRSSSHGGPDAGFNEIHTRYIYGPQGIVAAMTRGSDGFLRNPRGFQPRLSGGVSQGPAVTAAGPSMGLAAALLFAALLLSFFRFSRGAASEAGPGNEFPVYAALSLRDGSESSRRRSAVTRHLRAVPKGQGTVAREFIPGRRRHGRDCFQPAALASRCEQALHEIFEPRRRPRLAAALLALTCFCGVHLVAPTAHAALAPGASGSGVPVADQVLYFHHDHLGSSHLVTDQRGAQVASLAYEPYGGIDREHSSGEDAFRPKFTGKEWEDASDLYYFGARYYDPELGRFTSPDPARQFHSPYLYGSDDPLTAIDPDGEFAVLLGGLLLFGLGFYIGASLGNHDWNPAGWDLSSGNTWGYGLAAGALAVSIEGFALEAAAGAGLVGVDSVAIGGLSAGTYAGLALDSAFLSYDATAYAQDPSALNAVFLGLDIVPFAELLGRGLKAAFRSFRGLEETAHGLDLAGHGGEGVEHELEAPSCKLTGSSFPAGTELRTEDGAKAIEQLAVGDRVLAWHEESGELGVYPVQRLFSRIAPGLVTIVTGDRPIETTSEHLFFVEGRGWTPATDLQAGDALRRSSGESVTVRSVETRDGPVRVFNVEVAGAHTYFVSQGEVLAHNARCRPSTYKKRLRPKTRAPRRFIDEIHETTRMPVALDRGPRTSVYLGFVNDRAVYIGITRQSVRARAAGHAGRSFAHDIRPIFTDLPERAAKGVEQAGIERLWQTRAVRENRWRSIAEHRDFYRPATDFGKRKLKSSGYWKLLN